MNDEKDDGRHGAVSAVPSAPSGEREDAIHEAWARIAAARRAEPRGSDEPRRDAPPAPPPPTEVLTTLRSPARWAAGPASVPDGGSAPRPTAGAAGGIVVVAPAPGPAPLASSGPVVRVPALPKKTAPLPVLTPMAVTKEDAKEAPAAQPSPKRAAPRTVQSRVMGLGGTTPVGDDSIEKVIAAARSAAPLPALTLRQFASLHAELVFQPERRSEILKRYQVRDEAVLAALDAYWRRERAARPEVRTALADDYASHLAWLQARGLSPPRPPRAG